MTMSPEQMNIVFGILIVGALIIAFTFFSFTMLGWCSHTSDMPAPPGIYLDNKFSGCGGASLESHSITFQYKVGGSVDGRNQTECVICLAQFEEEESVRKLHSCKHVFHTCCIDRWLGSHTGCPLCRSQIDQAAASPNGNNHMILVSVDS
ncbi:RING-H2 finger protein ATL34-like [Arachis duranensis]|uniref:RING-H2 finger protein ATL34-like n=1 Tax=Arachis duranensis TaxID=130453 RepID=A0A6P4C0R2_ARADU|nr:RING-H2 finger protein ATL34-like [Arachis duranensis]